jgi:uncharacterized protein YndB with AHSA1/START domain
MTAHFLPVAVSEQSTSPGEVQSAKVVTVNDSVKVVVVVEVEAPPQQVYRCWTEPDLYRQWMGRNVQLDPTPGGEYFVEMGDGFAASGEFAALDPGRRVEFTWGWAPGGGKAVLSEPQPDDLLPPGSSRVVVTLEPGDMGTILRLEHLGLADKTLRDNHLLAWRTYLDRLVIVAAGGDAGPDPHS